MGRAWGWMLAAAMAVQGSREPVPDSAAQKSAEALVHEVFKDQYTKTAVADRRALARTLLDQARAPDNTSATRYVLLREAQSLGDLETSLDAIDIMARSFVIDSVALKLSTLTAADQKSSDELKSAAALALALVDEAIRAGDADSADRAAQLSLQDARKAKDLPSVSRAQAKAKEVTDVRGRLDTVRKAQHARVSNPNDPFACSIVGQFECFFRGNWEVGLELLAKGDQAGLKAAAAKDLAHPAEVAGQIAAGDAWWDIAERESGLSRESLRTRALYWYGLVLPRASGLTRVKIEARYRDSGRTPPTVFGGQGPYALDSRGFIRNWLVLGPFSNEGDRGFDTDFLGGEASATPGEGAVSPAPGAAPLKWVVYVTDTERVEFCRVPQLGIQPNQPDLVVYSACWAEVDADVDVQLRVGSDDGNIVWLDHRELGRRHLHRGAEMDQESYPLRLAKGKHFILIKVDQGTGLYQFMMRLVTPAGEAAPGVRILN